MLTASWSQPAHGRLQPAVRYTRPLWQFFRDHSSSVTFGMIDALGQGDHLPEGPDVETHSLPAGTNACVLVESILARWKKSGFCDPSDMLILHAHPDSTRSPLGDRRILGVHNLRECPEQEDAPNTIRHTSIHKAKGLDSKAVSRARQLLAIVANG